MGVMEVVGLYRYTIIIRYLTLMVKYHESSRHVLHECHKHKYNVVP